jgi:hypothetical protein
MVVEGINLLIKDNQVEREPKGILIALDPIITHLMFIDNLVMFDNGAMEKERVLKGLLSFFVNPLEWKSTYPNLPSSSTNLIIPK